MNKKTRGQKPLAFERTPKCVTTLGEECKAGDNARRASRSVEQATGRAASSNARNLAARAQLSDCAPLGSISNVTTMPTGKKNRRLLKVLGAGGLALFMGIGTLCGVLLAPMNAAQASTSADALTPQEQLLAGTLELDPENDPVVYTTDYGLEIKSHNAGIPSVSVGVSVEQPNGSQTVSSTTWHYISAGGYNWIIIGSYSASSYLMAGTEAPVAGDTMTVNEYKAYYGSLADSTPAGTAVQNDDSKQRIKMNTVTVPAFSNVKEGYNGEIPVGCVLCLCASNITTSAFRASGTGNNYVDSILQNYINNTVYGGTSTLSTALQALPIVPQKLITRYYGGTSTIENAYVFPLAYGWSSNESFIVTNYLDSTTKRSISSMWWLRSGGTGNSLGGAAVYGDGSMTSGGGYGITSSNGVRPAFVLKIVQQG